MIFDTKNGTTNTHTMPTYQGQKVSFRKMPSVSKLYEIREKEKDAVYRLIKDSKKQECCNIM